MNNENSEEKKEPGRIPDADENSEPIYKAEGDSVEEAEGKPEVGELSNSADESKFKDTPQDLKDTTSQE